MVRKKFPMLATLLLIFGIIWALEEMNVISIDIPWFPVIVIVVALGMIVNRYS